MDAHDGAGRPGDSASAAYPQPQKSFGGALTPPLNPAQMPAKLEHSQGDSGGITPSSPADPASSAVDGPESLPVGSLAAAIDRLDEAWFQFHIVLLEVALEAIEAARDMDELLDAVP